MEALFGFKAMREREAVRAFYGPAYEAIKRFEEEQRSQERLRRETENSRIDEVAHQINA
jgi:hypothetical protein